LTTNHTNNTNFMAITANQSEPASKRWPSAIMKIEATTSRFPVTMKFVLFVWFVVKPFLA